MTPTLGLLRLVVSHCANDGVLHSGHLIFNRVRLKLGVSGSDLGFASGVLFPTGLLQVSRTSQVADGLDDGAFDGVQLTSGFARQNK